MVSLLVFTSENTSGDVRAAKEGPVEVREVAWPGVLPQQIPVLLETSTRSMCLPKRLHRVAKTANI